MTSDPDKALATYRDLLAKVDAKFAEVQARHRTAMRCGIGCHSCCKPGLTVSALEAENLRRHFAAHPNAEARRQETVRKDPHGGSRCGLLDEHGACVAYEARPIVCRSHGVPIKVLENGKERLDVCPLNFTAEGLEALPPGDQINLETLNTILSLLNRQFAGDAELPRSPIDSLA